MMSQKIDAIYHSNEQQILRDTCLAVLQGLIPGHKQGRCSNNTISYKTKRALCMPPLRSMEFRDCKDMQTYPSSSNLFRNAGLMTGLCNSAIVDMQAAAGSPLACSEFIQYSFPGKLFESQA